MGLMFATIAAALAICGVGVAMGVSLLAYQRRLVAAKKPAELPAPASTALRSWKAIFREAVVSTDGELSPELEDFLADDDDRTTRLVAAARLAAEKERARIVEEARAEAEKVRAEILQEQEEWAHSRRPLLVGAAREEYDADYAACKTAIERGDVVTRWHAKGFRFSRKHRAEMLANTVNESTRRFWRQMFDEQDEDVVVRKVKGDVK